MEWKALKKKIDAENTRILETPPEDVEAVFKYEVLKTEGGTGGLMMGPWFEGATASRYIGAYYIYMTIKLAANPIFTTKDVKAMVKLLLPKAVGTAGLCGMKTFETFSVETIACIEKMNDGEDILTLLNSLYLYGSNMNAWIHHYMKWGVGFGFPIPTKADLKEMGSRIEESYA